MRTRTQCAGIPNPLAALKLFGEFKNRSFKIGSNGGPNSGTDRPTNRKCSHDEGGGGLCSEDILPMDKDELVGFYPSMRVFYGLGFDDGTRFLGVPGVCGAHLLLFSGYVFQRKPLKMKGNCVPSFGT